MEIILQSKLERLDIPEYATVCGLTNGECAAVCRIAVKTMRQYAELQTKTMRQYADRVVTHTRHPVVFALCLQRWINTANGCVGASQLRDQKLKFERD